MPDPIVITPAKLMHSVFCVRTGYFVISKPKGWFDAHPEGEGNPQFFTIVEHEKDALPEQFTPWARENDDPDMPMGRKRRKKVDLHILKTKKTLVRSLDNIVSSAAAVFVDGNDDDWHALQFEFDTMENALLHVGTGQTYATVQAGVNAAASGDAVIVHETVGNTYTENVLVGARVVQLVGAVPQQGITIDGGAGNGIDVSDLNYPSFVDNFKVEADGIGVVLRAQGSRVQRCVCEGTDVGSGTGVYLLNRAEMLAINCICYNWATGFYSTVAATAAGCIHCTAVDNDRGFYGSGVDRIFTRACLASDNTLQDYTNIGAARSMWNVSMDLTAPGAGSRTGFTNNNFVNYAGDDFRLNYPQNATGANIDGWPLVSEDYLGNDRERTTLIFYAGAHDPYVAAAHVPPYCCGAIDAAPAAQGCILIRFCEMECDEGTVPYRYDIHVKHVDLGPLTCAEIDAGTWYARSLYNDEVNFGPGSPVIDYGSPGPSPAILSALIAFEAYNQHGDNIHLFTNREYQIAVRAVAIDAADTIYEDDNCEVAISYSSGYQGIQWSHILSWPCTYFCDGEVLPVSLGALPPVVIGGMPGLEVEADVRRMPNVPVSITAGINFRDSFADFGSKIDDLITAMQSQRRQ